jgi:putative PEP-CTERM system histidine kinase
MTELFFIAGLAASAISLSMAALLVRDHAHPLHRALAAVLAASGLVQLAHSIGLRVPSDAELWKRVGLIGELAQAVTLFYAGRLLMELTALDRGPRERWRFFTIALVGAFLGALAWSDATVVAERLGAGPTRFQLGPIGRVDYIFIVMALTLGLAQLEQVLRTGREPFRYQLKFVAIGLGALGGYEIYQASRLLLVPIWNSDDASVDGVAGLISIGLVAYGLRRNRLFELKVEPQTKVYIAPQALYGSLTFLVIGFYLLGAGVIGELIRYTGQPGGTALSTLTVFVLIIGLTIVLSSRVLRTELKKLARRLFYRTKYDYRAMWLQVTEAFRDCESIEALLDRFLDILGDTFGAARISIWMRYEADGRFHQVRSANAGLDSLPLDESHPIITALMSAHEPLAGGDLKAARRESGVHPFWDMTKAAMCVPIRSRERLIGFVTLSRERAARYGPDDRDLLRTIAHHVAVLLSHASLAEERRAATELEALHRISAFCLHDIKNLAARLSLVAQNAEVHGLDPAFQQSAMRTVTDTVQKMVALITKLSQEPSLGQESDAHDWELIDIQSMIDDTLASLNGGLPVIVARAGEIIPPVRAKRDQLQQVFLNILLNARQACGQQGTIRVGMKRGPHSIHIAVSDTGPGISKSALRTLFQPCKSEKKEGLGIGLYQCKRIIDAHGGMISVENGVGGGTSVQITLPTASDRIS